MADLKTEMHNQPDGVELPTPLPAAPVPKPPASRRTDDLPLIETQPVVLQRKLKVFPRPRPTGAPAEQAAPHGVLARLGGFSLTLIPIKRS